MKKLPQNSINPQWQNQPSVGIDVSQKELAVCRLPENRQKIVLNDPEEIQRLTGELKAIPGLVRVVVEASGGYEKELVRQANEAGLPISCVNARQVRDLAKGLGIIAKNDRVDARVQARCGQLGVFRISSEQTSEYQQLQELNRRQNQLIELRKVEKTRLQQFTNDQARSQVKKLIRSLDEQIQKMEELIQERIDVQPNLARVQELVLSVPGIGKRSSQMLICNLPELGRVNRRQLASLVGVAPWDHESGTPEPTNRRTWGGRRQTRALLYMPTLSALRCNPKIRTFYNRLVNERHKPPKLAVIACMRKLLTILNTMVKNDELWRGAETT